MKDADPRNPSHPSHPSHPSDPNDHYGVSGPLTHERAPSAGAPSEPLYISQPTPRSRPGRSDTRDTSPAPKPGSMIVRIRDNEGHIVAVDYNRLDERWLDTATRLYNVCVRPRMVAPQCLRKIGHPLAHGASFGMHRLVFVADLAGKRTWFDPPVTVFVDRRSARRDEDHTRTLPPRPPFDPSSA